MRALERRCPSAEEIFELCEGSLEPGRRRETRAHLESCPDCRRLYEREKSLSAALSSPGPEEADRAYGSGGDTSRMVAMALPTRSVYARIMWGAGAVALLVATLVSLTLYSSAQPVSFVTHSVGALWGLTSGISDAAGILLAVTGPILLIALTVGALVDIIIAVMLLAVARWRRPRGA